MKPKSRKHKRRYVKLTLVVDPAHPLYKRESYERSFYRHLVRIALTRLRVREVLDVLPR